MTPDSVGLPPIRLAISPVPAHVRTARLVAVSSARQLGVADHLLDEVRQAVGEACTRAVTMHAEHGVKEMVLLWFSVEPREEMVRFVVTVRDFAPFHQPAQPAATLATLVRAEGMVDLPATGDVGLAVLAGLVDDLAVSATDNGPGTVVRMSWPLTTWM